MTKVSTLNNINFQQCFSNLNIVFKGSLISDKLNLKALLSCNPLVLLLQAEKLIYFGNINWNNATFNKSWLDNEEWRLVFGSIDIIHWNRNNHRILSSGRPIIIHLGNDNCLCKRTALSILKRDTQFDFLDVYVCNFNNLR